MWKHISCMVSKKKMAQTRHWQEIAVTTIQSHFELQRLKAFYWKTKTETNKQKTDLKIQCFKAAHLPATSGCVVPTALWMPAMELFKMSGYFFEMWTGTDALFLLCALLLSNCWSLSTPALPILQTAWVLGMLELSVLALGHGGGWVLPDLQESCEGCC